MAVSSIQGELESLGTLREQVPALTVAFAKSVLAVLDEAALPE